MWLLFLFFVGMYTHSLDPIRFDDMQVRYKEGAAQFAKCFDASFEFKMGRIFKLLSIEAAMHARSEICECVMKGDEFMKFEGEFLQKIGDSQSSRSSNSEDMSPLIGYLSFERDFVRIAMSTMQANINQLDRYIATGDMNILKEVDVASEMESLTEDVQKVNGNRVEKVEDKETAGSVVKIEEEASTFSKHEGKKSV